MARAARPRSSTEILLHAGVSALRAGHPWVFRDRDVAMIDGTKAGAEVTVFEAKNGSFVARGLYDPDSKIAVRLLSWNESQACGPPLIDQRISRAIERRRTQFDLSKTSGFRLIHGEGDGLPGLFVDRYDNHGVLRLYSSIWSQHLAWMGERICQLAELEGLLFEDRRRTQTPLQGASPSDQGHWIGSPPPEEWQVLERGATFSATAGERLKTGIYLDGREHRETLARYAEGRRVLNLFSYTAAYSVWAALAGAEKTVNVDLGKSFQRVAKQNFAWNGLDQNKHEFVATDAFEFLRTSGSKFDLIVLDPPSFSTSKKNVLTAKKGYQKLVVNACARLEPEGLLAVASNNAQTPWDEFLTLVGRATRLASRDWTILETRGLPADFPSVAALPESRYLKFAVGPLGN